jgi:hypothetical protein
MATLHRNVKRNMSSVRYQTRRGPEKYCTTAQLHACSVLDSLMTVSRGFVLQGQAKCKQARPALRQALPVEPNPIKNRNASASSSEMMHDRAEEKAAGSKRTWRDMRTSPSLAGETPRT